MSERNTTHPSNTVFEKDGPSIAVCLPCHNEELTIGKVVLDFRKALPKAKIYVFDNCSTDRTTEVAGAHGAEVIFSPIKGKGNVVRHMFEVVNADIYVMADGDDTYPAESVHDLLKVFFQYRADMVVGSRLRHFEHSAFRKFHQFGNHLVAFLIKKLFPIQVNDVLSGYRVFSKRFAKSVPLLSEGFEIETELTLQAVAKKFLIKEHPINYRHRPAGSFSKLNTFSDGILVLRAIFMIFKDYRPFVFYSSLGAILGILSLICGAFPIYDYVKDQYVSHVPMAILAASLGVLAMIFWAAGLILDTVSKYHNELFHVMKKIQIKNSTNENAANSSLNWTSFNPETMNSHERSHEVQSEIPGSTTAKDPSSYNFS